MENTQNKTGFRVSRQFGQVDEVDKELLTVSIKSKDGKINTVNTSASILFAQVTPDDEKMAVISGLAGQFKTSTLLASLESIVETTTRELKSRGLNFNEITDVITVAMRDGMKKNFTENEIHAGMLAGFADLLHNLSK